MKRGGVGEDIILPAVLLVGLAAGFPIARKHDQVTSQVILMVVLTAVVVYGLVKHWHRRSQQDR